MLLMHVFIAIHYYFFKSLICWLEPTYVCIVKTQQIAVNACDKSDLKRYKGDFCMIPTFPTTRENHSLCLLAGI